MVGKDLATGHGLFKLKGNKACVVWIYSLVVNRPLNHRGSVHTHGNGSALATKVPAQLFLSLDNVQQHGLVDGFSRNDEGNHVGTNVLELGVYSNNTVSVVNNLVLGGHKGTVIGSFSSAVNPKLASNTSGRPQVGTVCVVQFNLDDTLIFW